MRHKTYIKLGNGDKAVLFIHGFLGSPEHFEKFIAVVPENYGIYNILLDGHGGTVKDFANASMEKWKNQIEHITDEISEKYKEIIIVSHSMGTFFAMDASIRLSGKVSAIMLMQTPLKIWVKPTSVVNSMKSLFNLVPPDDEIGQAYDNAHSIKLSMCLWKYIGWLPRYMELFSEEKRGRETIKNVSVPCYIFQSEKDELVSIKSVKHIPEKENIKLTVLKNSAHFIYDKKDFEIMLNAFLELVKE